jgi:hypothetical protein
MPRLSPDRQTYIQSTKAPFFAEISVRAKQRGTRYRELMTAGHDVMITQPTELARAPISLS